MLLLLRAKSPNRSEIEERNALGDLTKKRIPDTPQTNKRASPKAGPYTASCFSLEVHSGRQLHLTCRQLEERAVGIDIRSIVRLRDQEVVPVRIRGTTRVSGA